MNQYDLIRTAHRVYGKGIREIGRETGHHRDTIRRAIAGIEPVYQRKKTPRSPGMDSVANIVEQWLTEDRSSPKKQCHTARRIFARLFEEHGFTGGEWAQFAKTGDPNKDGLVHWPAYESKTGQYIEFGKEFAVKAFLHQKRMEVLEKMDRIISGETEAHHRFYGD